MEDIIHNPNYLAYKLDFSNECIHFLPIEQQELRELAFLRSDAFANEREMVPVPLTQFSQLMDSAAERLASKPPKFIFHTAYCASTYLSRSLDYKGKSIGLREPQLLLDAANAKRLQWSSKTSNIDFRDLPKLALALLQKHVPEEEQWLIKPINSVNNIITELKNVSPGTRSVMLHSDAKPFLLSTLRKGEEGRQTIRAMFDLLRCDFPHLANLRLTDVVHMSDLKLILTCWRLQIEQAKYVLQQFSQQDSFASLNGEELIQRPDQAISRVNEFLQVGLSSSEIETILQSEFQHRDAKQTQENFSREKRDLRYAAVETFFGDDIDNGLKWLTSNNPGISLTPKLVGQLLG